MALKALAAAVFARFAIVELIRLFWERPRPFVERNINLLLEQPDTFSFPSGHAAFYFAIAAVVFLSFKKLYPRQRFWLGAGIFFLAAALIISLSRVYAGIHWPSDVLAGAAVGIFSAWLAERVFK